MNIFGKLFGTRQPSQPAEDALQTGVEYAKGYPSVVLSDFPICPQNLFYKGGKIRDGYLLNIFTIGDCLCQEFEKWRNDVGSRGWPDSANDELAAFRRTYERMHAKVPSGLGHTVNMAEVQRLIRLYVERVKSDQKVNADFMRGELTLFNITIDFCNTIGAGGALGTALEWFK